MCLAHCRTCPQSILASFFFVNTIVETMNVENPVPPTPMVVKTTPTPLGLEETEVSESSFSSWNQSLPLEQFKHGSAEKLYGREEEAMRLYKSWYRCLRYKCQEVVMITGRELFIYELSLCWLFLNNKLSTY